VILRAVILLLWLGMGMSCRQAAPQPPPPPAAAAIQGRRVQDDAVVTSGSVRLRSGASVRVGSQVSGIVHRLNVTVGAHIDRGAVIAEIDPRVLRAKLVQATAQQGVEEVALAKAQQDVARLRTLAASHLVAQAQFEDAQWQAREAGARLEKTRADVEAAAVELSYTSIHAPISGTVATVSTQEGETVAAAFSAPTFVTIVADRALELVAMVDETDIAGIGPGDSMEFSVEAYPSLTFAATVQRVDPTALIISGVVNYPVVGVIAGDLGPLKPDMTANVRIHRRSRTDLPSDGLR
jgi:RND family efflux transporter MFP subunit